MCTVGCTATRGSNSWLGICRQIPKYDSHQYSQRIISGVHAPFLCQLRGYLFLKVYVKSYFSGISPTLYSSIKYKNWKWERYARILFSIFLSPWCHICLTSIWHSFVDLRDLKGWSGIHHSPIHVHILASTGRLQVFHKYWLFDLYKEHTDYGSKGKISQEAEGRSF